MDSDRSYPHYRSDMAHCPDVHGQPARLQRVWPQSQGIIKTEYFELWQSRKHRLMALFFYTHLRAAKLWLMRPRSTRSVRPVALFYLCLEAEIHRFFTKKLALTSLHRQ